MSQARRSFLLQWPLLSSRGPKGRPQQSNSLRERLLTALTEIEAIDTHEHIIPESDRVSQPVDFFTLASHYVINDVVSAGLPDEGLRLVNNLEARLNERWTAFEPFWNYARFTGYAQALRIAIRDIYGFEKISAETLPKINEAIRAQNKPGLYQRILRDRARIRFSVVDDYWNALPVKPDPAFFVLAHKFDRFVTPATPVQVQRLEEMTGVSISTLSGLKQAAEKNFRQCLDAGMVTVKTTLAYDRDLHFREVEESDAARDFESMMRSERLPAQGFRSRMVRPFRDLEDHLFHHVVRLAEAHAIPMQIHTGLHAGNGNVVTNSNPTLLTNLFFLYPRARFDLFHISYPYQGELSVQAKLFPNVYADFCWAHIVSPSASRGALHEYLETVPVNKLLGFGGDYRYPELSYAHARMARSNIAQVLAEKTETGFCSEEEALQIGRMLLHDNPARLFSPRT